MLPVLRDIEALEALAVGQFVHSYIAASKVTMAHDSRYFSGQKKGAQLLRSCPLVSYKLPIGEIAEWRHDLKRNDKELLKTTLKRGAMLLRLAICY